MARNVSRHQRMNRSRAAARRKRGRRWFWLLIAVLVIAGGVALASGNLRSGRTGADPLSVLQTADFHSLAFSPRDPNVVFFGHHNGVLRSDDGGRTWRPLVDQPNFDAMGLAVSQGPIFLAGHNIFQVSLDAGATWRPVAHTLPGSDIHGFTMSPGSTGRLYAFVVGSGLFTSGDMGRTWAELNQDLPPDVMSLAASASNPPTLYAASMRGGLLRSRDGGKTWAASGGGSSPGGMVMTAAAAPSRRTVYAGSAEGLFRSTDGGERWGKIPFPGANVVAVAVSPSHPNVVLAITLSNLRGLVYRSEDGGLTWNGSGS